MFGEFGISNIFIFKMFRIPEVSKIIPLKIPFIMNTLREIILEFPNPQITNGTASTFQSYKVLKCPIVNFQILKNENYRISKKLGTHNFQHFQDFIFSDLQKQYVLNGLGSPLCF